MDKVTQLYETMMTRHSTMVIGPTGGGKTVVINTLVNAQIALGLPTTLYTLNPKVFKSISFHACQQRKTNIIPGVYRGRIIRFFQPRH